MSNLEVISAATPMWHEQPFVPEAVHLKGESLTLIKGDKKIKVSAKTHKTIEVIGGRDIESVGFDIKSCPSILEL